MSVPLSDICNNNETNMPSDDTYDAFNRFVFSNDLKLIGKLLHRFQFFEKTKHLAGDIVELGVYKGSGMATFAKFIDIFCHHSNKKVLGFDLFDSDNETVKQYKNGETMQTVYSKVSANELSVDSVRARLENTGIARSKYMLIEGDVCKTSQEFSESNPGFRAALIYVDLDLCEPVQKSLEHLWKHLVPGGYIVFDEYEYHKFDESEGVDAFLRSMNIDYEVVSTNWIAPTAYMIKKTGDYNK